MYQNRNNSKRPSSRYRKPGGFRGRGGRGGFRDKAFSDVSKFINKAVVTKDVQVYVPEHMFGDFAIDPLIKDNLNKKGYTAPTPIQDKAIPHILKGEDVVGIANTGTGKTAAFLIPLINKVLLSKGERVLIVAPTRELAFQIDEELRVFAKGSGLYSAVLIGGASMHKQVVELRHKPQFIIGTPGRIKDHMESGNLELSAFRSVVLDEADRMLDMGFIKDMRFMMGKMSKDRHTVFFSATLSNEIEALIGEFLKSPVRISVKTQDTSKDIDQDVIRIQGKDKYQVLLELLRQEEFGKVLIFSKTKHGAENLAKNLKADAIKSESIHGNKNQVARQKALNNFKHDEVKVLVATDVAARGLDISNISHVINYDLPATYEDYIHRIGRTGRGGKTGKALTFIHR